MNGRTRTRKSGSTSTSAAGRLYIVGASTRAAAFSALRAGLRPVCADLFADADLLARCPVFRIPEDAYPHCLGDWLLRQPPGPWLYTGALENEAELVDELARHRPLWGLSGSALAFYRNPLRYYRGSEAFGLPTPVSVRTLAAAPPDRRWLRKPLRGAGGRGIHPVAALSERGSLSHYYQEFLEGTPCSAIYCLADRGYHFLGATRQLVGEPWLRARPFQYCGSIYPLIAEGGFPLPEFRPGVRFVGSRGLIGIDYVLFDGVPMPVEVNPRYTASVEVLEYATSIRALAYHRAAFDAAFVVDWPGVRPASGAVGKAILYARDRLMFPATGPWSATLERPRPVEDMPDFADIPHSGEAFEGGMPVLTLFARAPTAKEVVEELKRRAAEVEAWLYR